MCWSGQASAVLATAGLGTTVYAAYRKEPAAIWMPLGYFSLMELLQAFTYSVIDQCSLPSNQIDDVPGQRSRHSFVRAAIGQDGDPDAKVRHKRHQCAPTGQTSAMKNQPVTAVALTSNTESIVRFAELGWSRLGVVDARHMQRIDQRSRQQALTIKLALAEMQQHPVREAGDRGVDRSGSHGLERETRGRQPRVLTHHVRAGSVGRGFKIVQGEANRHTKPVGQSRAYERFIALPADPFDEEANDVVAEVVVLMGRADIEAGFEIPHDAQQFSGCVTGWEIHPVVTWQPGLMTQEVEYCDPLGRHRIVQAKLGKIVTYGLGPVEASFILQ